MLLALNFLSNQHDNHVIHVCVKHRELQYLQSRWIWLQLHYILTLEFQIVMFLVLVLCCFSFYLAILYNDNLSVGRYGTVVFV